MALSITTGIAVSNTLAAGPAVTTGITASITLALVTLFASISTGIKLSPRMAANSGAIATGRYRH